MRTISLQHGRSQAESLPGPLSLFGAVMKRLWSMHQRTQQNYALAEMDERMLRDVGLTRRDMPAVLPIYLVR